MLCAIAWSGCEPNFTFPSLSHQPSPHAQVAIPPGTAATSEQTSKVVGLIESILRSDRDAAGKASGGRPPSAVGPGGEGAVVRERLLGKKV